MEDEITHWLELPAGTKFLPFGKLPYTIAAALWPTEQGSFEDDFTEAFATLNLEEELHRAVDSGALQVLDPLTFAPHAFPHGDARNRALVRVSDLRDYLLKTRRMGVRVGEPETDVEPPPPVELEKSPPAPAADPTSAPAVVAENAPLPLTTGDVAFSFDGLRYSESQWKKPLGDKPKWLASCVAIPGRRGVSETRWNPVLIGGALVRAGYVSARSVRARFQTKPLLTPWLDEWKTYEADHIESA